VDEESVLILAELLAYDGETGHRPLTDWEIRFIERLSTLREDEHLSQAQRDKLDEVWKAVFG
jgi:hypothetical protein